MKKSKDLDCKLLGKDDYQNGPARGPYDLLKHRCKIFSHPSV